MKRIISTIIICFLAYYSYSQEFVIYFEFDKYDFDKNQILEFEDYLNKKEITKVFLYGYTDTVGTTEYNHSLANKRIDAVKNFIRNINSNIEIHSTNYGEESSISSLNNENRKVIIKFEIEKYSMIEPVYNSPEIYQINNSKDTIIKCSQGTEIFIHRNSFSLINNKPLISDIIEFKVTEYYSPADMILANLTTQSDDEILETSGMIYLEAYSDNSECKIIEEKKLGLKFNNVSPKDSTQIFYGKPVANNINWVLESNDAIEIIEFEEQEVFLVVENMPTFDGGDISTFRNYINSNLRYPAIAIESSIQGNIFVQFTIDPAGFLVNPRIVRGVDPSLDFEVIRVVRSSPRWIPGTQNGQTVPVQFTIQIRFEMDSGLPVDGNNRIASYSEFEDYVESDTLLKVQNDNYEYISEFYLWTRKLKWINCDIFYRSPSKNDVRIKVSSTYESFYAIFNNNRSIMSPNGNYNNTKLREFRNLPSNQEILFVGIKIVNGTTYFTSFKTKPSNKIIEPDYKQLNTEELKEELKKVGL